MKKFSLQRFSLLSEIRQQPANGSLEQAKALYHRSRDLYLRGNFIEAMPLAKKAVDLFRKSKREDDLDFANALLILAALASIQGQYEEAEPMYLQAISLQAKILGEDHPELVKSLIELADFYEASSEENKAEELYSDILLIKNEKLENSDRQYAEVLYRSARLHRYMERYDEAEERLLQAIAIQKKALGEEHIEYAISLIELACLYYITERTKQADSLVMEAVEKIGKNVKQITVAHLGMLSISDLLFIYFEKKQIKKAEGVISLAIDILRATIGESSLEYAYLCHYLSALYDSEGDIQKAFHYTLRALESEDNVLRQVFTTSGESELRISLGMTAWSLDELFTLVRRMPKTDSLVETAFLWTLRRKTFINNILVLYNQVILAQQKNESIRKKIEDLRSLRKRVTNLLINPPRQATQTEIQKRISEYKKDIEILESELARDIARISFNQSTIKTEIDIKAIRNRLPSNTALVEFVLAYPFSFPIGTQSGEEWLSRFRQARYFAFVLTSEAPVQMIDIGVAEQIDRAARIVLEQIELEAKRYKIKGGDTAGEKSSERAFRKEAAELYALVFKPLEKALRGAQLVYLAPDGDLSRVPFEALVDERGNYLIQTYQFAYLSSGSDLLRHPAPPGKGVVVFAGPDYDMTVEARAARAKKQVAALSASVTSARRSRDVRGGVWDPLPEATKEGAEIKRILQRSKYGTVQVLTGSEATEEAFKALRSPRILHVASHGFFLPDLDIFQEAAKQIQDFSVNNSLPSPQLIPLPGASSVMSRLSLTENPMLRSGIVLAGANRLPKPHATAEERMPQVEDGWVTAEEIALMNLRGTELVVLSACETGLGSVRRGDGVSGLRRAFILAGARTQVVSLFKVPDKETRLLMVRFYENLRAGKGKLESLRQAQQWMRTKGGHSHPYYWASFVLVGDPQ